MDDNQNEKKTQAQKGSLTEEEEEAGLPKFSADEIKLILHYHKKWIESGGKEGEQANFYQANLRNLSFYGLDLQGVNLYLADMQKSFMCGVTGLAKADLRHANLEGATGLLGNEFSRADVTGTILPNDIKEFKALETVKEASQNARKIFLAMLLGCVYAWLTIATTTDVRLLTNTASSPLPIIGTEIPIAWFYIAAPLVLICLYIYFHLYLDNLWKGLASLPAIFPDGKSIDQTVYPWLLNSIVCRHFERLKKHSLIDKLKEWIIMLLAWWVVPITMMTFWLRYIPRHDWIGTIFHIGLVTISISCAIIFYRMCALTLQGKRKTIFRLQKFWKDSRFYYTASVVVICAIFLSLSYYTIKGVKQRPFFGDNMNVDFYKIEEIIPWLFEKVGYNVFANLREKIVSEKPDNYWTIPEADLPKYIKGAYLRNSNLEYADMFKVYLVKADLRNAQLNGAFLDDANLHKADLFAANLKNALLRRANLQKASLSLANLGKSNLKDANLHQADFSEANLERAYLYQANLNEADLKNAYLPGANFWAANLQKANFDGAYLKKVNFLAANLMETSFHLANLQDANLTGVKNLTVDQLSKVGSLYGASLEPELLEQVKECCPRKLKKPNELWNTIDFMRHKKWHKK